MISDRPILKLNIGSRTPPGGGVNRVWSIRNRSQHLVFNWLISLFSRRYLSHKRTHKEKRRKVHGASAVILKISLVSWGKSQGGLDFLTKMGISHVKGSEKNTFPGLAPSCVPTFQDVIHRRKSCRIEPLTKINQWPRKDKRKISNLLQCNIHRKSSLFCLFFIHS